MIATTGWLNDTSAVCTHDFEPYAEHVLELIILDRLGILPLMDALLGERPADGEVGDKGARDPEEKARQAST